MKIFKKLITAIRQSLDAILFTLALIVLTVTMYVYAGGFFGGVTLTASLLVAGGAVVYIDSQPDGKE